MVTQKTSYKGTIYKSYYGGKYEICLHNTQAQVIEPNYGNGKPAISSNTNIAHYSGAVFLSLHSAEEFCKNNNIEYTVEDRYIDIDEIWKMKYN